MAVMLRGTTWNLRKRVPARYAAVEPRKELWLSLHTDSKAEAEAKAPAIWRAQIEAWEARFFLAAPGGGHALAARRSAEAD